MLRCVLSVFFLLIGGAKYDDTFANIYGYSDLWSGTLDMTSIATVSVK
jgi:hypothetical protein